MVADECGYSVLDVVFERNICIVVNVGDCVKCLSLSDNAGVVLISDLNDVVACFPSKDGSLFVTYDVCVIFMKGSMVSWYW